MADPIVVTEEMRQAVYQEDCDREGHIFNMSNLLGSSNFADPRGKTHTVVRAVDPEKLPHLTCDRCRQVWIVLDEPGTNYRDAITRLRARIAAQKPGKDAFRPRRRRGIEEPFVGGELPKPPANPDGTVPTQIGAWKPDPAQNLQPGELPT